MSTQTMTGEPTRVRTYFGWQQEKVAFIFGLSGQRVAVLVAAVLVGVWPVSAARMSMAVVAWPVAALLAGIAFARFGGRTVDEWASAFVSYQGIRLRHQHKFLSAAFTPSAAAEALIEDVWAGTQPAIQREGRHDVLPA